MKIFTELDSLISGSSFPHSDKHSEKHFFIPGCRNNLLYDNLTAKFRSTIDKHAPMKTKILRGNDAPFMNKELRKEIYVRSCMKNRVNKDPPTNENMTKFKQQGNKCVKLRKKAIKDHFKKATSKGIISNKEFWGLVKPYLSNRGGLSDNNITLIKHQKIITDEPTLCQLFIDHYIKIVQNSSGRNKLILQKQLI